MKYCFGKSNTFYYDPSYCWHCVAQSRTAGVDEAVSSNVILGQFYFFFPFALVLVSPLTNVLCLLMCTQGPVKML